MSTAKTPLKLNFMIAGTIDFSVSTSEFQLPGSDKEPIPEEDETQEETQEGETQVATKEEENTTGEVTLRCNMNLEINNEVQSNGQFVKDIYGELEAATTTGEGTGKTKGVVSFIADILKMPKLKKLIPDVSSICYLSKVTFSDAETAKTTPEKFVSDSKMIVIVLKEKWQDKTAPPNNFLCIKIMEEREKSKRFSIELRVRDPAIKDKKSVVPDQGPLLSLNNFINAFTDKGDDAGSSMKDSFALGVRLTDIKFLKEIPNMKDVYEDTKKPKSNFFCTIHNKDHPLLQVYSLPGGFFFCYFKMINLRETQESIQVDAKNAANDKIIKKDDDQNSDGFMRFNLGDSFKMKVRDVCVRYMRGDFQQIPDKKDAFLSASPFTFKNDETAIGAPPQRPQIKVSEE